MDSWQEHLALGVATEIPFLIIMYLWKGWFDLFSRDWLSADAYLFVFSILVVSFVSPLVMDLDHKQGKLREGLTFLGLSIGLIGMLGYYFNVDLQILMVIGLLIATMSYLIFYLTHHRGIVHSIPFCLIYGFGVYILLNNIQLGVLALVGCYSHLIGDKELFKFW